MLWLCQFPVSELQHSSPGKLMDYCHTPKMYTWITIAYKLNLTHDPSCASLQRQQMCRIWEIIFVLICCWTKWIFILVRWTLLILEPSIPLLWANDPLSGIFLSFISIFYLFLIPIHFMLYTYFNYYHYVPAEKSELIVLFLLLYPISIGVIEHRQFPPRFFAPFPPIS